MYCEAEVTAELVSAMLLPAVATGSLRPALSPQKTRPPHRQPAHFGHRCVHCRIAALAAPGARSFTEEASRLAVGYGGSASGEHGDRRARGELLPLQYLPPDRSGNVTASAQPASTSRLGNPLYQCRLRNRPALSSMVRVDDLPA
jgi:hypothetical protein